MSYTLNALGLASEALVLRSYRFIPHGITFAHH